MAGKVVFNEGLKEIRLILCQTSPSSAGVRDFVRKHYVELKSSNPNTPVLIREGKNIEPKLYARFNFGEEINVPLSNVKSDGVLQKLVNLQKK